MVTNILEKELLMTADLNINLLDFDLFFLFLI